MKRSLTTVAVVAVLALPLAACTASDEAPPDTICGTPISPDLSGPLLEPHGSFRETSKVDRNDPQVSAPCVIVVDDERALSFRFSWHKGAPGDLLALSRENQVYGLVDPAVADLGFEQAVLGNDGATATAPCNTAGGDHFTLTVQAKRAYKKNPDLRPHVEAFMRTYMAQTLKTLNCG